MLLIPPSHLLTSSLSQRTMQIDPWILAFSALTVIATIWMGFWSAKRSRTAHDFFVAGPSGSLGWEARAVSGGNPSRPRVLGVGGGVGGWGGRQPTLASCLLRGG